VVQYCQRLRADQRRLVRTELAGCATLIDVLRARAPRALYDDRRLTQWRRSTTAISRSPAHKISSSSNASGNDRAVHLLVIAHLNGQL